MASRREEVVQAVLQLVRDALPNAEVERDAPWPQRAQPGGLVIVRDGDPGPAEECFSPRSYTYRHEIEVEVFGPEGAADQSLCHPLRAPIRGRAGACPRRSRA